MKNSFAIVLTLICFVTSSKAQVKKDRATLNAGEIIALRDHAMFSDDYVPSKQPYQENILGVATGVKEPKKKSDVIVKEGVVDVRINNENGPVKKGDYITSSSTAGTGMKATESGMIIGVALEDAKSGSDFVKIRLQIQYIKN